MAKFSLFRSRRDENRAADPLELLKILKQDSYISGRFITRLTLDPYLLNVAVEALTSQDLNQLFNLNTDNATSLSLAMSYYPTIFKKIIWKLSGKEIENILRNHSDHGDSFCIGLIQDRDSMQTVVKKVSIDTIFDIAINSNPLAEVLANTPHALEQLSDTQIMQLLSSKTKSSFIFVNTLNSNSKSFKIIIEKLSSEQLTELFTLASDNSNLIDVTYCRICDEIESIITKLNPKQIIEILSTSPKTQKIFSTALSENSNALNLLVEKLSSTELVTLFSVITSTNDFFLRELLSDRNASQKLVQKLSSQELINIFAISESNKGLLERSSLLLNTKTIQLLIDKLTPEQLLQFFSDNLRPFCYLPNTFIRESFLPLYNKFSQEGNPEHLEQFKKIFSLVSFQYSSTSKKSISNADNLFEIIPADSEYGNNQPIKVFEFIGDKQKFFAIQIGEASQQQYMLIGSIEKVAQLMEKYEISPDSPNGISILNATKTAFTLPEKSTLVEL